MSGHGAFHINQAGEDIQVELTGNLDTGTAAELEKTMGELCKKLPPQSFHVTFVLLGLSECAQDARPILVRIQQTLAHSARRTAYLDDRPRFRGLALWVMHVAEDPTAKAVATPAQARAWLSQAEPRTGDARRLLQSPQGT